jgi:hypothetical protein
MNECVVEEIALDSLFLKILLAAAAAAMVGAKKIPTKRQ